MSLVSNKKLLFFLADEQNRTYYVDAGIVKKSSLPAWIQHNPDGWKDITFQFATNQKYFSTLRAFTTALKFVKDGQAIIADRMINGAGTEEIVYLIIMRQDPTMGLNAYRLEYKSRLDFSKFNGDPRTGIAMNTLQDDVFAMVQANESVVYSLPCNSSNPAAIQVLFDGTLLQDKLNYNVVKINEYHSDTSVIYAVPLAFINSEGDNIGTIINSQNFQELGSESSDTYCADPANSNFALSFSDPTVVTIKGTFSFIPHSTSPPHYAITSFFQTSLQTIAALPLNQVLFDNGEGGPGGGPPIALPNDKVFTVNINCTINLAAGERLFFLLRAFGILGSPGNLEGVSSNISVLFASKADPSIAFGLRVIDVLKQLVSQITNGKFTADSKFFSNNNRKVIFSGSSLRSFPDAVIQITFADLFQSLTSVYNLGLTVRGGVLWIEPVEDIYNSNNEILNLSEISEATLTVAQEFIFTSAKVGYVKQTYNKRNGRYEYNCTHNYKFPIYTVLNQLNLVSPIRGDSFGAEFIRTGYPNLNTTDDKGDADLFAIMVADTVGHTTGVVSNAIAFNIETLVLAAPVIKTPFSGATIYFANPTITGVSQPNMTITIFVDGTIDGTTLSDINGNWTYEITRALQPVSLIFNGVHRVEATAQTDPGNISGFSNLLSFTVNTTAQSPFLITAPTNNDTVYNNLPLITGIAPAGSVVSIKIDGVSLTTAIANTSGIWSFQSVVPLSDATHVITATVPGLTDPPAITITVNKNVATPLITNIIYNQVLYTNLPLIKGVGIPGVTVSIYLDGGGGPVVGGIAGPLGTAVIDGNGDWSFQTVDYVDPSSLITEPFLPEGLHIISTTATPVNVLAFISGYQLMRGSNKGPVMDYDGIRLDDQYIPIGLDPATLPPTLGQFLHPETLYNIEETTPLRMLRNHDNITNGFLAQQPSQQIVFNGAEINANLVTSKNGVVFNEGANVNIPDLAPALYRPFYLNFKTKVPDTFNDIMTSINNDGYITALYKNIPIYLLPIGQMNMKPATNEAQNWKLLISGKTPLITLLQLFSSGIFINLNKNMVYISDINSLHFVKYNFTPPAEYHLSDIYDDWQKNRFPRWLTRPDYYQPVQKSDKIALQMITNGVGVIQVQMFSITSGLLVDTFPLAPVVGSLVQLPNILQEVLIDPSTYPEDQYWFALFVDGSIVAITEKIWLKTDWPDTMLFEYGGSTDEIDYYFSTGIMPMIRVQSEFLPWNPESEVDNYEDENGDFEITRGIPLKTRDLLFILIADWMALKMNLITLLDNWKGEGTHYTRNNNSKMEKEDFGPGVPEFSYKMEVIWAQNQRGMNFSTPGDSGINAITYTLDAVAFGMQPGVINVTEESD